MSFVETCCFFSVGIGFFNQKSNRDTISSNVKSNSFKTAYDIT